MGEPERELAEDGAGAASLDVAEAAGSELLGRVQDDEVVGVEAPADVVDADGGAGRWQRQGVERGATAAYNDSLATVDVPVSLKDFHHGLRSPGLFDLLDNTVP